MGVLTVAFGQRVPVIDPWVMKKVPECSKLEQDVRKVCVYVCVNEVGSRGTRLLVQGRCGT